jgi:hypothetical protein
MERWIASTRQRLISEIDRLNVYEVGKLKDSIRTNIYKDGDMIVGEISFPVYGRFVDMGAGRRAKVEALSMRKPKKWYSPTFYKRLNVLQGAIGIQIMEDSLKAIKNAIENGPDH